MNAIYSSESQNKSDPFRPDNSSLLAGDFDSGERLCLARPFEFDYDFEEEFARTLDQRDILWQYKPHTFAVEWDENGNFIDSFTPSFFLPARDVYIELVAPECGLSNERVRKARLLRQQHPAIRIEVLPFLRCSQMVERLC
jgi:hypothetical protein